MSSSNPKRPDIVLMDIRMPVMDGVLGTKLIKESFNEVKVVILTTFKDDEYIKEAIKNILNRSNLEGKEQAIEKINTINYDEYSKAGIILGRYLDEQLNTTYFSAESGTIKQKMNFCDEIISIVSRGKIEWDLTDEITELCEKTMEHIRSNNPKD